MSRALAIIGVTGQKSGGYFAKVLAEHKDEVCKMFDGGFRAIVRRSSNTWAIDSLPLHFDKWVGSLDDIDFLKSAFLGVDTVVHIAGIHFSEKIVNAAAACNVRRLILVHTTGIYSKYKKAGDGYRQIDKAVQKTCKDAEIILTILRPTMIYGNTNDCNVIKFIQMVDKFPLMPVVNGARYGLQPVNYKDLGTAYYQVLMHEITTAGHDFNLSGGEPIELRDMLTVMGNALGKKTRFVSIPFFISYFCAWIVFLLTLGKIDYREKVQRLCEPRVFAHDDASKAFGYRPMTFEAGVVDEVQEYLQLKQKYIKEKLS